MSTEWRELEGASLNSVQTNGELVRRRVGPWSPAIHSVIRYLEEQSVPLVPKLYDSDRLYEYHQFMPGQTGFRPWASEIRKDSWPRSLGSWLKLYHQAIEGFSLPSELSFCWGPRVSSHDLIVCHGDLGPWNILFEGESFTAIIDWDLAKWGTRLDNVTQAAIENMPLRRLDENSLGQEASADDVDRRLEIFCESLGEFSPIEIKKHAIVYLENLKREVVSLAKQGHPICGNFVSRNFPKLYQDNIDFLKSMWSK